MTIHITKKDFKTIYKNLKQSAQKRNIPFLINIQDLYNITIPLTCPILGIPIFFNTNKVEDNSISFDRIDNNKGYEKDNIIVISFRANKLKSDASFEEIKQLYEFFKQYN